MKKFALIFCAGFALAFFSLSLCSCASSKPTSPDAQEISVGGVLQTNDRHSYFIILGRESKNARTFFFVKDAKNAAAWKSLRASVGQKVLVKGKVVNDGSPWLKTVSVENVSYQ